MDENLARFLGESPLARKIRLEASVVVSRTEMSPRDVVGVRRAGSYGPVPAGEETCELHVGGQCVALGKIVRRKGAWYFRTIRLAGGGRQDKEERR